MALALGVVTAGSVAATVVSHANADAAYQAARVSAVSQRNADQAARVRFAAVHSEILALQVQLTQIHDMAAASHLLPDAQITVLSNEAARLGMYAGFKAGEPVVEPKPHGTPTSTTAQLQRETDRLNELVQAQKDQATTTDRGAAGIAGEIRTANATLTRLILGDPTTTETPAVPTLGSDAAGVIASFNKAGQGEKTALTASASEAIAEAKVGKPAAALLMSYLATAHAVEASHEAAVVAEVAAAAAAEAAARESATPSRGATTGSSAGQGRNQSAPATGGSSHGAAGTPTGGSGAAITPPSSGGSSGSPGGYTPPPVDHTPHVVANGAYTPDCNGVRSYSQSTSSGGEIVINVGFPYTYETYSTPDGWGLTVFGCA